MPDLPTLTGDTLVLRAPVDTDAAALVALGRDPEVTRWYGMMPEVLEPLDLAWAENWLAGQARGVFWMITRNGEVIGNTGLHNLWRAEGRAHMSISLLASADLGRGYGREAIRLVLAYAFDTLNLHRIGIRVMATNERAIRCYKACGFVQEGLEREAALTAEGRVDDLMMGLLASEWRAAA